MTRTKHFRDDRDHQGFDTTASIKLDAATANYADEAVLQTVIDDMDDRIDAAGGWSLTVQDEGSPLTTAATTLDFVGSGVTASGTGATKTITITGGGATDWGETGDIVTQAFSDTPAAGSLDEVARADHRHGMPASGAAGITVQDEGSPLTTAATTIDFTGAGVTASGSGATKTVNIPGGGSGITVQDEGSPLSTAATTIDFVGAGVTATGSGATKTVTIPGDIAIDYGETGDITTAVPGDTAAAGSLDETARADHRHGQPGFLLASAQAVIDGGGSAITTGIKGDLTIPFACTIERWRLLADASGSIVVDIWKDTYANYPPIVGDSITASAKPTLSSVAKNESSTLTGWTTSVAAGDCLRFNVDSASTVTRVTLELSVRRT